MHCLNCGAKGIPLDTTVCPKCSVHLPTLLRDVLPHNATLQSGKYQIDYAIGRGGFGVTYQAQHVFLERLVAIKEFFPQESALREGTTGSIRPMRDTEGFRRGLDRFQREGKILAKIEHPNIVRILDFFEERGTGYLVMELLHGESLRKELDRAGGKLEEKRVKEILEAMVEGLAAVHQREIFHLDLKPENVMVMPDGRVALVDFGAAKQTVGSKQKDSTTRAFTMAYAAPEVLSGRPLGAASDIFELGMMAYEMLVGELPPSAMERFLPGSLEWLPSELSEPWQTLVKKSLEIDPKLRPANVRDWINILKEPKTEESEKKSEISVTSTEGDVKAPLPFIPVVPVVPKNLNNQKQINKAVRPQYIYQQPLQQNPKTSLPKIPLPSKSVLLLGAGAVVLSVVGFTINNFVVEQARQAEQAEKQVLEKIKAAQIGNKFVECLDIGKSVQSNARIYTEVQSVLKMCQVGKVNAESEALLLQAKDLAKKNFLENALSTVNKIDPSSSVYAESQNLVEQWSQSLLKVATAQYQEQGKLKEAIALTKNIPPSSPTGKTLPQLTDKWTTEWQVNETAKNAAEKAIKESRWNDALASSKKVTTVYWQKQMEPIAQKANAALAPVYVPPAQPAQIQSSEPVYQPPVYQEPAPVYREPEPVYQPPVYQPPSLPAPNKGN